MNRLLKMSFDRYGYDGDFLNDILGVKYGDDFLFRDEGGMLLALEGIRKRGDKIIIFPDFDMDGISAGAILYAGLSLLGLDAEIYAPDVSRGYGISPRDIDDALAKWPEAKAMITCDVGITCGDAIEYARAKGLRTLVTDHHPEPDGERVPADFIMDPSRSERECPFEGVCGAYVAYHLIVTYARLTGNEAIMALASKLSIFAALGSCGDVMPVIHDTRKVILDGLREFNALLDADDACVYLNASPDALPDAFAAPFENLRKLHFALLREGIARYGDVTHTDLGFTYCPMFNSVKRMGASVNTLYELLYARGNDSFDDLAEWLVSLNKARKEAVAKSFAKLRDPARTPGPGEPYIFVSDCLPGICGLLAMKIMERTDQPCIVVREDPGGKSYSGSGRAPEGFPRSVLEHDGVRMAGHEGGFGVSIDASVFDSYAKDISGQILAFAAAASEGLEPAAVPTVRIGGGDCDFSISSVEDSDECFDYAREIDSLRPFGRGFAEPEHILEFGPEDILNVRTMGKHNEHLKLALRFNIQMVLFGGASRYLDDLAHGGSKDRVYRFRGRFSINEYNGCQSLQFVASGAA